MARAWNCLCRLLLFLIFLLPPPAAPGQPAGECAGPGRACRPHPSAPFPFPDSAVLPSPSPPEGRAPLVSAPRGGSGSRCPSLPGWPWGRAPVAWPERGRARSSRVPRGVPGAAGASGTGRGCSTTCALASTVRARGAPDTERVPAVPPEHRLCAPPSSRALTLTGPGRAQDTKHSPWRSRAAWPLVQVPLAIEELGYGAELHRVLSPGSF